jgi:hypothetical protein
VHAHRSVQRGSDASTDVKLEAMRSVVYKTMYTYQCTSGNRKNVQSLDTELHKEAHIPDVNIVVLCSQSSSRCIMQRHCFSMANSSSAVVGMSSIIVCANHTVQ